MIKTIRWAGIEQKNALKSAIGEWPQIALFNFLYCILFIFAFLFYSFNSIKMCLHKKDSLNAYCVPSEHRLGVMVASNQHCHFLAMEFWQIVNALWPSATFFFLQKWYPSQSLLKDFGLWNSNNKWSIKRDLKF